MHTITPAAESYLPGTEDVATLLGEARLAFRDCDFDFEHSEQISAALRELCETAAVIADDEMPEDAALEIAELLRQIYIVLADFGCIGEALYAVDLALSTTIRTMGYSPDAARDVLCTTTYQRISVATYVRDLRMAMAN